MPLQGTGRFSLQVCEIRVGERRESFPVCEYGGWVVRSCEIRERKEKKANLGTNNRLDLEMALMDFPLSTSEFCLDGICLLYWAL